MIDPHDFSRKQMELAVEFAQFIVDHPEIDETLPADSYVYFEIAGEPAFNQYSVELAERRRREDGVALVRVRIKGLAPLQGSRLIDPIIEPSSAVA